MSLKNSFSQQLVSFSFDILIWDAQSKNILTTITAKSAIVSLALDQRAQFLLFAEADSPNVNVYQQINGDNNNPCIFKHEADLKVFFCDGLF